MVLLLMLSIVIPTLNDRQRLGPTLECVNAYEGPKEIIVSDGGSDDQTFSITAQSGGKFYMSPKGRGEQLAAGAHKAIGDWLLFLHADTKLGPGWTVAVNRFMENPDNRFRVGYFTFTLDDLSEQARRLERIVHWRCQKLSLPYGDQGLLISRPMYDSIGGYSPIPLMEDIDIIQRISNHRLENLPALAITSATKFKKDGYILRPLRNLLCLCLFFIGVPSKIIVNFYNW
jgi:rSAM/selenodomain-associated transferase 2